MFIGFDYGTANCSVAIMRDGKPQLLKMENGSTLLPSMLCAPTRESVSEWLYRHHDVPTPDDETQALLRRAIRFNRDEDIDVHASSVQFGLSSLGHYIDDPEEVYFVKSPKSFLGASGLKPQQVALFEDLVCAMMLHIRQQAQNQLPEAIIQAVIGRPINFQGLGGDEANSQAQGILERAAKRAGFQDVVFQYEPVAAGLDYEATLQEEKRVLVVDIGGGTTDCSLLLMGPQWHHRADRESSLLGHSGCRVGGNDLERDRPTGAAVVERGGDQRRSGTKRFLQQRHGASAERPGTRCPRTGAGGAAAESLASASRLSAGPQRRREQNYAVCTTRS